MPHARLKTRSSFSFGIGICKVLREIHGIDQPRPRYNRCAFCQLHLDSMLNEAAEAFHDREATVEAEVSVALDSWKTSPNRERRRT
jgi:hypothetical protein